MTLSELDADCARVLVTGVASPIGVPLIHRNFLISQDAHSARARERNRERESGREIEKEAIGVQQASPKKKRDRVRGELVTAATPCSQNNYEFTFFCTTSSSMVTLRISRTYQRGSGVLFLPATLFPPHPLSLSSISIPTRVTLSLSSTRHRHEGQTPM